MKLTKVHKLKIYIIGRVHNALRFLIRFYQIFISPNSRKNCRFWPSCSQYVYQAIEKHGIFKGSGKGIWRILNVIRLIRGE